MSFSTEATSTSTSLSFQAFILLHICASVRIEISIFGPHAVAVRRLERELADGVVEVLALDLGDLELERRRPARAVGAGEGARTPGGACVRGKK